MLIAASRYGIFYALKNDTARSKWPLPRSAAPRAAHSGEPSAQELRGMAGSSTWIGRGVRVSDG
jgi:hypothetical protein